MQSTKIPTDLLEDPIFRANMAAAIRQYGRNGLQIHKADQQFCGGCGRFIPIVDLQTLQHEPVFCQNCGRLIVDENDPYRPALAIKFS